MTFTINHLKFAFIVLSFNLIHAQTFQSKVVDQNTKEPIPYATIQFAEHSGTISNEEGVFNFTISTPPKLNDSIRVSSMGYEKRSFSLHSKLDSVIYLAPMTIELRSVFLSNKPLDTEEIIKKVKENLDTNFKVEISKKKVFFRQSDLNQMKKVDIAFEKSTIEELNKQLIDSIVGLIPRHSTSYLEALGDLYGNYTKHKLYIDKAAELYDKTKDVSMDGLSEKMERIFKENVKPDSYLKIKSGLFGTKVQLDSLKAESKEDADNKVKVENTNNKDFNKQIKNSIRELYEQLFFKEDSKIDILQKSNRYEFTLTDYTYIDESPVYILKFEPKGKKDFKGTMYVNMDDYAIMRLEFDNVRPIKSFGLLGITFRHNVYKGKMLFQKDVNGGYSPKYLELESGVFFGLDRPLKVIEKNKYVKGRRKQNELSLELDIEMIHRNKYEMVVFDSENISEPSYENAPENKEIKATYLSKYDPDFWQGHNIMEPNAAIQAFMVVE